MALTYELIDRISFGNVKMRSYKVTDAQAAGQHFGTGMRNIQVKAINETDTSDTFKESITDGTNRKEGGAYVYLAPVSNDDDGHFIVWGR